MSGLEHDSGAGARFTSVRYTNRLAVADLNASIGAGGDSYESALAETTDGLYKAECAFWEGLWAGADDLEPATLGWVYSFNTERIHSALTGARPPRPPTLVVATPRAATARRTTRSPLNPDRFSQH